MKAFCLSLPETPDQVERARAHFIERGLDVEFVAGINAKLCGLATSNPYEVDNPGSGFHIGEKLTGVFLGWYLLWSVCNHHPDSHFLLFEQDVVLHPDFKERMAKALQDVPKDFDWLFLGSCCTTGQRRTYIQGEVWDIKYPLCSHAAIVAKKCLPHVLATQRKLYGPNDCTLVFHSFDKMKVFTVLPTMADQLNTNLPV
jgi:GR25 family glycosyltransferase involved in LPS biosynthesis